MAERYPDLHIRGTGVVTYYDYDDNFGFIDPDDEDEPDVVFSLRPGDAPIEVGDHVVFEIVPNPQVTPIGKMALRVWKSDARPNRIVEPERA